MLIFFRTRRIHELILPLDTVLDDSIGCAMWFASRGRGLLNGKPYTSPARVVLSGLGADEQLGGYSRYVMKRDSEQRARLIRGINYLSPYHIFWYRYDLGWVPFSSSLLTFPGLLTHVYLNTSFA